MSLYQNTQTQEIRPIDDDVVAAWIAAGNPKASFWAAYTPPAPEPVASTDAEIYAAKLGEGYFDETTGITLKTTEYAQTKFTSQVALVQLALSVGALDPQSAQTIFDASDTEQQLTTADFLGLMLRYGAHCQALFINYAP